MHMAEILARHVGVTPSLRFVERSAHTHTQLLQEAMYLLSMIPSRCDAQVIREVDKVAAKILTRKVIPI